MHNTHIYGIGSVHIFSHDFNEHKLESWPAFKLVTYNFGHIYSIHNNIVEIRTIKVNIQKLPI